MFDSEASPKPFEINIDFEEFATRSFVVDSSIPILNSETGDKIDPLCHV